MSKTATGVEIRLTDEVLNHMVRSMNDGQRTQALTQLLMERRDSEIVERAEAWHTIHDLQPVHGELYIATVLVEYDAVHGFVSAEGGELMTRHIRMFRVAPPREAEEAEDAE